MDDPICLLLLSPSHLSFSLPTPPPPKPLLGLGRGGGRQRDLVLPIHTILYKGGEKRRVIYLSLQFESWDPWGGQRVP